MNNSCLPEYVFSEANCSCLLTRKSAFCYRQRKILSPKVICCLHSEVGPLVSLAACLPQPRRSPGSRARCRLGGQPGGTGTGTMPAAGSSAARSVGLPASLFLQSVHGRTASDSSTSAAGTAPRSPPAAGIAPAAAPGPSEGCQATHPAHTGRAG